MRPAFHANAPHVHKMDRWIASLSDGSTIFEDKVPGNKSAWLRMKDFLSEKSLFITGLRIEYGGRFINLPVAKDENGNFVIDGYWHGNKICAMVLQGGDVDERFKKGIGYVKENKIFVSWVSDDGTIEYEIKEKSQSPGTIINEKI